MLRAVLSALWALTKGTVGFITVVWLASRLINLGEP
jgi:hypothetical protein